MDQEIIKNAKQKIEFNLSLSSAFLLNFSPDLAISGDWIYQNGGANAMDKILQGS